MTCIELTEVFVINGTWCNYWYNELDDVNYLQNYWFAMLEGHICISTGILNNIMNVIENFLFQLFHIGT